LKGIIVFLTVLLMPALVLGAVIIISNSSSGANNAHADFLAGNEYAKAGDYTAAVVKFEEAVRLKEGYEEAMNNLAFSYNKLGEFEKAAEVLDELSSEHPEKATYYYDYAVNIVMSLQKDNDGTIQEIESALAAFRKAEKLSPGLLHVKENIAFLEDLKKQYNS
jgi:tetratricopeptide (TPR) repeat protein